MEALLDAGKYSKDQILAYISLFVLLLFFVFSYALLFLFEFYSSLGFIETENAPSLCLVIPLTALVWLVISLRLKLSGEIFKSPLRIYETGMSMHSNALSFEPAFVPFQEIRSIILEFEWSITGIKGCGARVTTGKAELYSKEFFSSKERYEEFAGQLDLILTRKGFTMQKREEKRLGIRQLDFVFSRK